MRIISGKLKGRKLHPPKDDRIRPTSDRTRESLFNLLMHGELGGNCIIDQPVLDLCCGTGALGFEALSRGASMVCFVDSHGESIKLAEKNADSMGVRAECRFYERSVTALPDFRQAFSLVLMDAPYNTGLIKPALEQLIKVNALQPAAIIALEHAGENFTYSESHFEQIDERKYGKARVTLLRSLV